MVCFCVEGMGAGAVLGECGDSKQNLKGLPTNAKGCGWRGDCRGMLRTIRLSEAAEENGCDGGSVLSSGGGKRMKNGVGDCSRGREDQSAPLNHSGPPARGAFYHVEPRTPMFGECVHLSVRETEGDGPRPAGGCSVRAAFVAEELVHGH